MLLVTGTVDGVDVGVWSGPVVAGIGVAVLPGVDVAPGVTLGAVVGVGVGVLVGARVGV